jgi:hypothetical protein
MRILPQAAVQTKNDTRLGALTPPNTLPWKLVPMSTSQSKIERPRVKYPILSKRPSQPIRIQSGRSVRANQIKKMQSLPPPPNH